MTIHVFTGKGRNGTTPLPPHWQLATLEPATLPHWQHFPPSLPSLEPSRKVREVRKELQTPYLR